MRKRPILLLLSLLALAVPAASGPATAQQPPTDQSAAGAEIRVEQPRDLAVAAPSPTRASELDGFPLGLPLTMGLIVVAVALLVGVPLRVRRAMLARRARRTVSA
ncbi:MAG: hypothetical protein WD649_04340 [Thermoleophilaceae bacterium]